MKVVNQPRLAEQRLLGSLLKIRENETIAAENRLKVARKEFHDHIGKHGDLEAQQKRWEEWAVNKEIREELNQDDPESWAWRTALKEHNERQLRFGMDMGWWESVENGQPIPWPVTIEVSTLHEKATMANVMVMLGLFESVSQARKAGKDTPLVLGEHRFKRPEGGMIRAILK